jgi:hypothetical protein
MMANDRLYLYCTSCGRFMLLVKSYGPDAVIIPNIKPTIDEYWGELVKWIEEHQLCGGIEMCEELVNITAMNESALNRVLSEDNP